MEDLEDLFEPPKTGRDALKNAMSDNGNENKFSNPDNGVPIKSGIPDFTRKGESPIKRKLAQGDTYNSESKGASSVDNEVVNVKEKKSIDKKIVLMGAGVLALVIFGAGLVYHFNNKSSVDTESVAEYDSGSLSDEAPSWDDNGFEEDFGFKYSDEQLEELRAAGYTGSEIEEYQKSSSDFDTLIAQAKEARLKWANETIAPVLDGKSEAYKKLEASTWLGLKDRTSDLKKFKADGMYTQYDAIKNFDYEKVEPTGVQLFLKVYIDGTKHKNFMFINVTPSRYKQLKQKGNIIIKYTYVVETKEVDGYTKENKKNMFVIAAEEYIDNNINSDTGDNIGNDLVPDGDTSNSNPDSGAGNNEGGFEDDGF